MARKHPGEVEIVAVGRLTEVAIDETRKRKWRRTIPARYSVLLSIAGFGALAASFVFWVGLTEEGRDPGFAFVAVALAVVAAIVTAGAMGRRPLTESGAEIHDHLRGLDVPKVHFGLGTDRIFPDITALGVDAVGVDWRIPLDDAAAILGDQFTVQGNIDPAMLTAPWPALAAHIDEVLERGQAARAHVVNLGHGVPPETDPDVLTRIVRYVHGERDAAE